MDSIKYEGVLSFDLEDKTKKHISQSEWKKTAFILFNSDICEYYSWYLFKRFHLILNKPLRKAHVSLINDSINDIRFNNSILDDNKDLLWKSFKNKYNHSKVEVSFLLDYRSDNKHWWLNVSKESKEELQKLRNEIGLSKPFFGLHLTIGLVNEKNQDYSDYIRRILIKEEKEILNCN